MAIYNLDDPDTELKLDYLSVVMPSKVERAFVDGQGIKRRSRVNILRFVRHCHARQVDIAAFLDE